MEKEVRLIDANSAVERLKEAEQEMRVVRIVGHKAVSIGAVIQFLEERPTVDAVEVGSDPTAAGGGNREGSEWQRSAGGEPALSGEGSAGYRNRTHGQWKKTYTCSGEWLWAYECDQCNAENPRASYYCPNCGAKMDGGENDGC